MTAMQEMKELVARLNEYAYQYYVLDQPTISDAEYDILFDRLLEMEQQQGIVLENSPTIRVGGKVLEGFAKHTHIAPLYSLNKAKTVEELRAWEQRLHKVSAQKQLYTLEYKFDGLTINLTYEQGKLVMASTRGDGETGEEILEQARTIKSIPLTIPFLGRMEVQGEAIMHLSDLEKYNRTAKEPLKNARNACAGALRNLDTGVTAARNLDAYFYNVGYIEGKQFATHTEMIGFLKENRFKVNEFERLYDSLEGVLEGIREAEANRHQLDFLIDGMVIKVDDFALREQMGYTERFPRWAIAYKFAAEEMTTRILDILWDVGRTGRLTPTALVEEVEIGGATVRRATLNNIEDIRRKQVAVGSRVFIRRSNDVIPEILGAVPGEEREYHEEPKVCPYCGAEIERIGPNLYCPNSLSCKPQLVARIAHYASREAMNIENLSDKTAELLYTHLQIADIAALYELQEAQLLRLPGFKEKRVQNLLAGIEGSKQPELANFIYALGINTIGKKTAKDLAEAFGTFEALQDANMEQLIAINEVGEVMAQSVVDFFASEQVKQTLLRLFSAGVHPKAYQKKAGVFQGKKVVLTGTLVRLSRSEAGLLIEQQGGELQSSVGKSTDVLIAGVKAGSKLNKAQALGIEILEEAAFYKLLDL